MAMADYYLCDVCGQKAQYDADIEWNAGAMAMICVTCAATHQIVVISKVPVGQLATSDDLRAITEQVRRAAKTSPDHYDHARGQRFICLAHALDRLHATPGLDKALKTVEGWVDDIALIDMSYRPDHYALQQVVSALRHLLPATPEQTNEN